MGSKHTFLWSNSIVLQIHLSFYSFCTIMHLFLWKIMLSYNINAEIWFFVTMPVLMWWRNLSIFRYIENAKIKIILRMWWICFSSNINETSCSYLYFVPDGKPYWCWRCTAFPCLHSLLANSGKFLHKVFWVLLFFLVSWLPCRSKILKCSLTTLL